MRKTTIILAIVIVCSVTVLIFDNFQNLGYEKLTCKFGSQESCGIINRVANTYFMGGDLNRAKPLLQLACDAKFYKSCTNLGNVFEVLGDKNSSLKYHQISCDGGFYGGCNNLARLYMLSKDYKKSAEISSKQCENGSFKSCFYAGIAYIKMKNKNTTALSYLNKACDGDIADACGALGAHYIVQSDFHNALKSFQRGCDKLNDQKTCKAKEFLSKFTSVYAIASLVCKGDKNCKELASMNRNLAKIKEQILKMIDGK